MMCYELKDKLDALCRFGHAEDEVIIVLAEKSIGAHASSGIAYVSAGFDWDKEKILVNPAERLVSEMRSRDIPKNKIMWHSALVCPTCEHTIKKKSNYCDNCGQRLSDIIKVIE